MNVVYLQPYVARYRVPLYDRLQSLLTEHASTFTVAAGRPLGEQGLRDDQAQADWLVTVPSHVMRTPLGEFKFRRAMADLIAAADVCVMELDVGNLNAWFSLPKRRPHRPGLVLWGHGKCYTTHPNFVTERLKACMAGRADHIMTYTPSGREHMIGLGIPAHRVTSVGNSTDTYTLQSGLEARMRRTTALSEAFGLDVSGRLVAMYAGGLDGDKRIPFLTEAVRHASSIDPGFLLLVAGSGSEQDLVRSCSNVAWIPHADRAALVDMAAVSQAVWMPGRVGLVAVDAMALGLPILTTSFPFHAPEFEFLTPGVGVHTLPDSPVNFASDAIRLMRRCSRYVAEDLPSINRVADAMMGVLTRVSTQGNTRAVTHPDAESRGGCDGAPAR